MNRYASEVDIDFVRKSVRTIGRLAIKISSAADLCISVLLQLVKTKVSYVVQEAIVVIKDIFRRYPNQYEGIIGTLCENLDALDTPDAKAAMIWIVGQYADRIENSDELLDDFLVTFLEEPVEVGCCDARPWEDLSLTLHSQVQLALLTATVKLFIKRPTAGQELVPKVLKWATEEVDNPDLRDRGFIYWRMLSTDPGAATDVVLADKPTISTESEAMDHGLLDRLLLHTGTLASIYQKEAVTFVRGARPKYLQDSPALSQEAKDSYLEALRLPSMPKVPGNTSAAGGDAPSLPPRPTATRQESSDAAEYGMGAPRPAAGAGLLDEVDEDDEEEGAALNPGSASSSADDVARGGSGTAGEAAADDGPDDPLDPYASLARMSLDGFGTSAMAGGGRTAEQDEYGYSGPQPVNGGRNDLLL